MTDNDINALIIKAVAVLLLTVVALTTSCQMQENYLKAEALKSGANPPGVSCVFDTQADCALSAAQGKP